MNRTAYKRPDTLLDELGITEPSEIQIEAIAQHCGATVVYEPIDGSDARILGYGDRAIITVDSNTSRARQRFSAAHELGHWLRDRGRIAFSCAEQALITEWSDVDNPERNANRFAANLLLPHKLFAPKARQVQPTLAGVRSLAEVFETSLVATAIRLVELGSHPAILVCTALRGRKWFTRSSLVLQKLWLAAKPGLGTIAAQMLAGTTEANGPVTVDADEWIEHPESFRYCVVEDSIRLPGGLILTLIWWKDEAQILELRDQDE